MNSARIDEPDDNLSAIIAKAIGEFNYTNCADELPDELMKEFDYLINSPMVTHLDLNNLRNYVQCIYESIVGASAIDNEDSLVYPSISEILTYIDEENLTIIDIYFKDTDFSEIDIDTIRAMYIRDISPHIHGHTITILENLGLPLSEISLFSQNDMRLVGGEMDSQQEILIYDFFY